MDIIRVMSTNGLPRIVKRGFKVRGKKEGIYEVDAFKALPLGGHQAAHMEAYHGILSARIQAFKKP